MMTVIAYIAGVYSYIIIFFIIVVMCNIPILLSIPRKLVSIFIELAIAILKFMANNSAITILCRRLVNLFSQVSNYHLSLFDTLY